MYGKRNTSPELWYTPRFNRLSPNEKLTYLYILAFCDWAGFLEIDEDRIAFDTKINQSEIPSILENLDDEEIVINEGWLLVVDFIEMQGNSHLNPNNNAHKNIINKIRDNIIHFKNCNRAEKNLAPYMTLVRPSSNSNGKAIGSSQSSCDDSSKLEQEIIIKEDVRIWAQDFNCNLCGVSKNEKCRINSECKFPEHCK